MCHHLPGEAPPLNQWFAPGREGWFSFFFNVQSTNQPAFWTSALDVTQARTGHWSPQPSLGLRRVSVQPRPWVQPTIWSPSSLLLTAGLSFHS